MYACFSADLQLCPSGSGASDELEQRDADTHSLTPSPLPLSTPHTTLTSSPLTARSAHYTYTFVVQFSACSSADSWNSESEGEGVADGPLGNFQTPRTGGLNLREAMARSTTVTANGKDDAKEQRSPPLGPRPPVGVTNEEPRPPVGVVNVEPPPPMGVVSKEVNDENYSDWDDEEEEVDHAQQTSDSAHIPAVGGASRELSAVQNGKREGEEDRKEREGERRDDEVGDGMGMDLEEDSNLSTESEPDLPVFGGYTPSSGPRPLPQGRLPPISQGELSPSRHLRTPSPTPTSPTIVTPLSATTGKLNKVGASKHGSQHKI